MLVYAAGSAGLAWIIKYVFNDALNLRNQQYVAEVAWGIVGLYFLKGIGSYVSSYLMAGVGQRVVMDVRNALYRHVLGLTDRPVIASGGVRSADDIWALRDAGCEAAVTGKALYEKTLKLSQVTRG